MLNVLRLFAALAGIALASGLVLGKLHQATVEKISENVMRYKKVPALLSVQAAMRGGGELSEQERAEMENQLLSSARYLDVGAKEPLCIYVLSGAGETPVVAIEGFGEGYGGKLGVMTGIDVDSGGLTAVGITTMSETPGVGTRVLEPGFTAQFVRLGKDAALRLKKDGGDLDGVSGATISSQAVMDAVRQAKELHEQHKAAVLDALSQGS